jgi:hypothetical protein
LKEHVPDRVDEDATEATVPSKQRSSHFVEKKAAERALSRKDESAEPVIEAKGKLARTAEKPNESEEEGKRRREREEEEDFARRRAEKQKEREEKEEREKREKAREEEEEEARSRKHASAKNEKGISCEKRFYIVFMLCFH